MKLKMFAFTALAAVGFTHVASADATIDITGATAFRQAAVNAIYASFSPAPLIGHSGGAAANSFNGATAQIFKGTFPGISGTTWVRTFWSGSTEGANVVSNDITENRYIAAADANVSAGTTGSGGTSGRTNTTAGTPEMYFSDVSVSNTNFTFVNQAGVFEDVLFPSSVGAVVFTMIKNEAPVAYAGLTNVTSQQFRALFSNTNSGRARLSQFTGLDTDDNLRVYATGRNDLSGTRSVYLLETGYGASNIVNQWKISSDASNQIRTAQLWPINDGANASLQWVGDIVNGNGGFSSGGTLNGLLDDTSPLLEVRGATGNLLPGEQGLPGCFVTMISQSDAAGAINNGAVALSYNGVGITPSTSGLGAADRLKITNGAYTLWSFERFVPSNEIADSGFENQLTAYTTIFGNIEANIGTNGLTLGEMAAVSRATDGATVTVTPP